jgi:hypothetical protein
VRSIPDRSIDLPRRRPTIRRLQMKVRMDFNGRLEKQPGHVDAAISLSEPSRFLILSLSSSPLLGISKLRWPTPIIEPKCRPLKVTTAGKYPRPFINTHSFSVSPSSILLSASTLIHKDEVLSPCVCDAFDSGCSNASTSTHRRCSPPRPPSPEERLQPVCATIKTLFGPYNLNYPVFGYSRTDTFYAAKLPTAPTRFPSKEPTTNLLGQEVIVILGYQSQGRDWRGWE